jgi:hypothetical protein
VRGTKTPEEARRAGREVPEGRPPVVPPGPERRERLGAAAWVVGPALLVMSLPGPWLTIGLPAGLAFALHDRRPGVRVAGLALAAASAFMALVTPGGAVLVTTGLGAAGTCAAWVARGRPGSLDALAAPALAGAAAGCLLGAWAAPEALTAWEAALGRGVAEGAESALARYRDLGMDPAALASLDAVLDRAAAWTVRVWPALAALGLWLGAWLAGRLLARWGRIVPEIRRRVAARPFTSFAVGEWAAWILILALAGLWVSVPAVQRVAVNVAIVAAVLFVLDGAAVVGWWLAQRRVSAVLRTILVLGVLVFALPLAVVTLALVGLADLWIQFRHRPRVGG